MAGDLGRMFPLGPAGDHAAEGAYRVNPTGKDQGRSAQERFRDSLDRRKRKHAGAEGLLEEEGAEPAKEDAAGEDLLIEDRVSLSSKPETTPVPTADSDVPRPAPAGPATPEAHRAPEEKPPPPPASSGHVNVVA
jgi:hypothetical protein